METINLNGKEYVLKEAYDADIKQLETMKIKEAEPNLIKTALMDCANVTAIIKVPEYHDTKKETLLIPNLGLFKLSDIDKVNINYMLTKKKKDWMLITPNSTKIAYSYYEFALKMFSLLFESKVDCCELYEGVTAEGVFKKDFPVVFFRSDRAVVVAPRVTND